MVNVILYAAMTLCALFSFHLGLRLYFSKRAPRYVLMIVFGIGCAMLGRMFETLMLLTQHEIHSGFHVGLLGILGSFMFFMAANYGTMDMLVDDGSKGLMKYRLIALCAPVVILAIYVYYYVHVGFGAEAIVNGVLTLVIMLASYYHLKHLIIPDVEDGIIRHIRQYNLVALVYALLCMLEMIVDAFNILPVFRYIVDVAFCVVYALFIPVLYKGVKQWTI